MSPTETLDWAAWFRRRLAAPDASASAAAEALRTTLATDGAPASLKRFLRDLRRADVPELDPWRVDVVVQRLDAAGRPSLPCHPLWTAAAPLQGVDEPDIFLRSWALARSHLEAALGGRAPDLTVDGAPEVAWLLTGEAPEVADRVQLRNRLALGEAVFDSLGGLGLVSPEALERRRTDLDEWRAALDAGGDDEPEDRLVRHFGAVFAAQQPLLGEALAIARASLLDPSQHPRVEAAARAFVAERFYDEPERHPVAALAQWCGRAQAVALIGGCGVSGLELDGYRDSVAGQLAEALGPLLRAQPLWLGGNPVGFVVWRAVVVLVRDCLEAGRRTRVTQLVDALAETGSWTRARTKELLRLCRLLQREDRRAPAGERIGAGLRRELSLRLVARLALTTCRKRERSPSRLWRTTLRSYAKLGSSQPEVAFLRRWWEPRAPEEAAGANPAELLKITRLLAGREWPEADLDGAPTGRQLAVAARWWRGAEQAALLAGEPLAPESGSQKTPRSSLVAIPGGLAAALSSPALEAAPATGGEAASLALHVDFRFDRYGEGLVELILFSTRGGQLSTRLTSSYYERPVAQTDALAALGGHLAGLRRLATEGRSSGPGGTAALSAVRRALADLAPAPFWSALAEELDASGQLELDVDDDFGVPWELAPLGPEGRPLALRCAVTRSRRARAGGPTPQPSLKDLLVLYDPTHAGVDEEVAAVTAAWTAHRPEGRVVAVGRRSELDEPTALRFDVIHYAGHRALAPDGTPALQLAGGALPLVALVERTYRRPPSLLVLNACTTLSASESLASGSGEGAAHLVYGSLEPLRQSSVPAIIGTLWDIQPPPGAALFDRFYRELLAGVGPASALLAARRLVATRPDWSGSWEAYVVVGRPPPGQGERHR